MAPARYVKQTWTDGSGGGTPLSAARMGVLETGIFDASSAQMLQDSTAGGAVASFDFTSIISTFSHLVIVAYLRGDAAVTDQLQRIRFNNDSGANYYSQLGQFFGASSNSTESFAATSGSITSGVGASATANFFGSQIIVVPHYTNAARAKGWFTLGSLVRSTVAAGSNATLGTAGGTWNSTAAINRVTILPNAGNFVADSRVTIYGLG